jgi:hypothetical protein
MARDAMFDHAQGLQREAKRLFDHGRYAEALPVYQQAAMAFRALAEIPWIRVFFCEATAVRCLEELLEDGDSHLTEYTTSVNSFFSEWSEASISLRITAPHLRAQAFATHSWRETARRRHAEFFAVSAQHALAGDFAAARRVLDDALTDVRQRSVTKQEPLERLVRSKRAVVDAYEERRKPLALRSLARISRAYRTAARICRRPAGDRERPDPLEDNLSAFRAFYLSSALSWSASDILRAGDKGSLPPHIALSRAASRYECALRLADVAISATKGEGIPRGHRPNLDYWRWTVRSRARLAQFVATADDTVFEATWDAWAKSVEAAKVLCEICGEHNGFPNRFFNSLTDLINEEHWLRGLQAYAARDWKRCIDELTLWVNRFPKNSHDSWRHRQGRIRLVYIRALLSCLGYRRIDVSPEDVMREIEELQRSRAGRGPGRAAEQLLGYAHQLTRFPMSPPGALVIAQHCQALLPIHARIQGEPPAHASSRLLSLPADIADRLLQPLPRGGPLFSSWRRWFFAAYGNLLRHMHDYYTQLGRKNAEIIMEQRSWILPNGMKGEVSVPRDLIQVIGGSLVVEGINELWESEERARQVIGTVATRIEQLARLAPLIVDVDAVEEAPRFETAVASPDWALPESKIELLRPKNDGEPLTKGKSYLPPEYGTGYLKNFCRIGSGVSLIPVTIDANWGSALGYDERWVQKRCIVLTEDTLTDALGAVLWSNGFVEKDTEFVAYGGCTKINSAMMLGTFLLDRALPVRLVLHRDRDHMSDEEAMRFETELRARSIAPLLTAQSDIESYFISANHIHTLNPTVPAARIQQLIDQATQDTANDSVESLVNQWTQEAFKQRSAGGDPPNHGAIAVKARDYYSADPATYRRGKIVLRRLISLLQQELGSNPKIRSPSEHLKRQSIASIAASIWSV